MDAESYYQILGITTEATDEEVRKAYRRQALLWHPDKNRHRLEESEIRFKQVAEAYEILSDPEKRQLYDEYGDEGLKPGTNVFDQDDNNSEYTGFRPYMFHDPNEIFRQFFGVDHPFAGMFDPIFNDPFFGGIFPQQSPMGFGANSNQFGANSNQFGANSSQFGANQANSIGASPFGVTPFAGPFGATPFVSPFGVTPFGALSFGGFPSLGNTSTFTSINSFSGGGSAIVSESSTTTIRNGVRTTTIRRTDAQGNVTLIQESSDGTRTETINGQLPQYQITNNQQQYG